MATAAMEKQGDALRAQAVKELGRWFTSASSKNDAAAECYMNAANKYRVAKKFLKCGAAFQDAALLYMKNNSLFDAANAYREAAKILKLADAHAAQEAYEAAIQLFAEAGKCRQAAKLEIEVAEMCEKEQKISEAKKHYQSAADFFIMVDQPVSATGPRDKVAQFTVEEKNWVEAMKLYEELGRNAMEKRGTAMKAKKYFFNAWLACFATTDSVNARVKIDEYKREDHRFESSDECKLSGKLLEAFEALDVAAFATLLANYDRTHHLEPYQITMLMAARSYLDSNADSKDDVAAPAAPSLGGGQASFQPGDFGDSGAGALAAAVGGGALPPAAAPPAAAGGVPPPAVGAGSDEDDFEGLM